MKPITKKSILTLLALWFLFAQTAFAGMRIKDIARIRGTRENQLVGYGLVVGLDGTGDKANTIFTIRSVTSMLRKMGMTVGSDEIQVKNVAAVMITATLPAFAREGSPIDVTVSSIGDASSLEGGILLQAPLRAANNQVYAVAQGAVSIGGRQAGRQRGQGNYGVVGVVPNGGIIENEVPTEILQNGKMELVLNNPDFTTASRVADEINKIFNFETAKAIDASSIEIDKTYSFAGDIVSFLSALENIEVMPDRKSVIVINEKTGTIILGENIKIAPVAIAQGNLSISIDAQVDIEKNIPNDENTGKAFYYNNGNTVKSIVKMLNAIGASPDDIISILQALKAANAIDAEIQIM